MNEWMSADELQLQLRIHRLRGENAMLFNVIRRAQRLIAQQRYDEANTELTRVIQMNLNARKIYNAD
jgi:hypothetical protein